MCSGGSWLRLGPGLSGQVTEGVTSAAGDVLSEKVGVVEISVLGLNEDHMIQTTKKATTAPPARRNPSEINDTVLQRVVCLGIVKLWKWDCSGDTIVNEESLTWTGWVWCGSYAPNSVRNILKLIEKLRRKYSEGESREQRE